MEEQSRSPPSHSFVLRLWPEKTEVGEIVWRGRVQNADDGEVRYFQGWKALREVLLLLIEAKD